VITNILIFSSLSISVVTQTFLLYRPSVTYKRPWLVIMQTLRDFVTISFSVYFSTTVTCITTTTSDILSETDSMFNLSTQKQFLPGASPGQNVGWTDMASAERKPITGAWRRTDRTDPPPPVKSRRICINFGSDL